MNHVALQALRYGVAVHHGQLPRPFLAELESLLRRRVLTVAISSPTLAQGVDLSFGVLIFKSLWRTGELLPPKEFANVVGRVGRAFVDLDGVYVLPVHESDPKTEQKRLNEFHKLVKDARGRELESGLYLLIAVCLIRLRNTLELSGEALSEYVLNQQELIDKMAGGSDHNAEQMEVILAELDAGIIALVDDLDCDASEIAAKLDDALNHSLWKRRLAVRDLNEQHNQFAMLHGRANHIWRRTSVAQRKGFYSASIGTESGMLIVNQAVQLETLLDTATMAIEGGDISQLSQCCCELAEILFQIYPFQPTIPKDWDTETWKAVLDAWISGATLHRVTDSVGIAFVQDALVFRLVWAIEAVRTVLAALSEQAEDVTDSNDSRTFVAICMTYGVPSVAAARMLECGMESRLLAIRLAKELDLSFTTRDELILWFTQFDDFEPLSFSEDEREAWRRFIERNEYSFEQWTRLEDTFDFRLGEGISLPENSIVRLVPNGEGTAELYAPDFGWLGRTDSKVPAGRTLVGITTGNGTVSVRNLRPPEIPEWLKEYRAAREL
ncbi:hypothetical protein [Rhodopirellula europaea]|uniref:hypothetical protein n=1 Tax=Rhodopirellula europaea TaxID=1263866 RepID=UPI003D283430